MRAALAKADIFIFTDGLFLIQSMSVTVPARMGAAFFDRSAQFPDVVTNDVLNNLVFRATKIFMVVLISIVLVPETFSQYTQYERLFCLSAQRQWRLPSF